MPCYLHWYKPGEPAKLFSSYSDQTVDVQFGWMEQFGLTDEEKDLVRRRDWIGLWRAGMSIYVMVKLLGVTGVTLPEVGKQMRESGGNDG